MQSQFSKSIILLLLTSFFGLSLSVNAQSSSIDLNCGDIVQGETTPNDGIHTYRIIASAGTILNLRVEPIGNTFNVYISLRDSGFNQIAYYNDNRAGVSEIIDELQIGSSNPTILVGGVRPDATGGRFDFGEFFGAYRIFLGCDSEAPKLSPEPVPPDFPPIPENGFPGLAPVDFADGITIPLVMDAPNSGALNPGFDSVFGFTFSGNAGDSVTLDFNRLSGNLNLGVAILSGNNEIAYMAALVTSQTMSSTFTLPSRGDYTIGVFRVDLIPPSAPEATAFTIQASIGQ